MSSESLFGPLVSSDTNDYCASFPSIAVIKHHDQSNLGEPPAQYTGPPTSITNQEKAPQTYLQAL